MKHVETLLLNLVKVLLTSRNKLGFISMATIDVMITSKEKETQS